ncbi:MAG: hypothetical protein COU71_02320 [Parcubacteria group bacterium CG10_big_fil_rev_8_21_14_0_10_38_31]|nr:MAG: hypothetical protein COU71_02320 [Parcubacteria group bacterium CG10_big_fil_rev_8_21_14_0_10_38_31]
MNKNLITYIVGGVVIIGFIIAMALLSGGEMVNNKNPLSYSAGTLSLLEGDYDFGVISMADGNVPHSFEVRNESVEPVTINKVYTSCMCTTAYVVEESGERHGEYGMPMQGGPTGETNIEILPGGSAILEAIFDPAAHGPQGVGKIKRVVYLETNSQTKPKLEVTFEAEVTK